MHRERYIENILLSDPNSLIKFEEKIDKEASIFSSKKKLDDELNDKYRKIWNKTSKRRLEKVIPFYQSIKSCDSKLRPYSGPVTLQDAEGPGYCLDQQARDQAKLDEIFYDWRMNNKEYVNKQNEINKKKEKKKSELRKKYKAEYKTELVPIKKIYI